MAKHAVETDRTTAREADVAAAAAASGQADSNRSREALCVDLRLTQGGHRDVVCGGHICMCDGRRGVRGNLVARKACGNRDGFRTALTHRGRYAGRSDFCVNRRQIVSAYFHGADLRCHACPAHNGGCGVRGGAIHRDDDTDRHSVGLIRDRHTCGHSRIHDLRGNRGVVIGVDGDVLGHVHSGTGHARRRCAWVRCCNGRADECVGKVVENVLPVDANRVERDRSAHSNGRAAAAFGGRGCINRGIDESSVVGLDDHHTVNRGDRAVRCRDRVALGVGEGVAPCDVDIDVGVGRTCGVVLHKDVGIQDLGNRVGRHIVGGDIGVDRNDLAVRGKERAPLGFHVAHVGGNDACIFNSRHKDIAVCHIHFGCGKTRGYTGLHIVD